MPKFSQNSIKRLATCHPELQILFNEVIKHWDCKVLEGHRGQQDQDAAYARGTSKLKYPDGKHNAYPSLAVDVAPYPMPKWEHGADFYYFGGFVMGVAVMLKSQGIMRHSIRCGIDWNGNHRVVDESFIDSVHFEIIS